MTFDRSPPPSFQNPFSINYPDQDSNLNFPIGQEVPTAPTASSSSQPYHSPPTIYATSPYQTGLDSRVSSASPPLPIPLINTASSPPFAVDSTALGPTIASTGIPIGWQPDDYTSTPLAYTPSYGSYNSVSASPAAFRSRSDSRASNYSFKSTSSYEPLPPEEYISNSRPASRAGSVFGVEDNGQAVGRDRSGSYSRGQPFQPGTESHFERAIKEEEARKQAVAFFSQQQQQQQQPQQQQLLHSPPQFPPHRQLTHSNPSLNRLPSSSLDIGVDPITLPNPSFTTYRSPHLLPDTDLIENLDVTDPTFSATPSPFLGDSMPYSSPPIDEATMGGMSLGDNNNNNGQAPPGAESGGGGDSGRPLFVNSPSPHHSPLTVVHQMREDTVPMRLDSLFSSSGSSGSGNATAVGGSRQGSAMNEDTVQMRLDSMRWAPPPI